LPELKRELVRALRTRGTVAVRLGRRLEQLGDDPSTLLDHVLSWHIQLIDEARRTVRPEAFTQAIDILSKAQRTVIFGIGPSGTLADYMRIKLVRFGREAAAIKATGMALADALMTLRRGDALLVMDYGSVYLEVRVTLERARVLGIPVVLLTDNLALELAGFFDVALQAPRGRVGALGSVVNTMVVLDALLLGLANRERATSINSLSALNDLRARIVGYRIDIDSTPYEEGAP
jgi:DNA-binding MurR/RpiR family transcriptional regulator